MKGSGRVNYEDFYQSVTAVEKNINDKLENTQKSFKSITRYSEKGNIKNMLKEISQIRNLLNDSAGLVDNLHGLAENFDIKTYFESGEFVKQIIQYCKQYSVDIKSDSPAYDIFPYKIRIDAENQEIQI